MALNDPPLDEEVAYVPMFWAQPDPLVEYIGVLRDCYEDIWPWSELRERFFWDVM